ncbi:MAG: hypothetical protein N3A38_07885 [Planctomycetota bacterium]|nr:hypothetical protein [Planctomycetota bacterium]
MPDRSRPSLALVCIVSVAFSAGSPVGHACGAEKEAPKSGDDGARTDDPEKQNAPGKKKRVVEDEDDDAGKKGSRKENADPGKEKKPSGTPPADPLEEFGLKQSPKNPAADAGGKPDSAGAVPKPAVQKELCKKCGGRGLIPCPTHSKQPLILGMDDKPPDCCGGAGFTVCPDCDGARQRYEAIANALASRHSHLENVQRRINQQFKLFQTPHACYFSQLSDEQTLAAVRSCENLAIQLKAYFKDGGFDVVWPPDCRVFIISTQHNYEVFFEALSGGRRDGKGGEGEGQRDLHKRTSGAHVPNLAVANKERMGDPQYIQGVTNLFAHVIMKNASGGKAPAWLEEGFASWCEYLMFRNCRFYTIAYEDNRIDMRGSWSESVRKGIVAGTTLTIPQLMEIELRGLKPLVYQQCWSFATYLIARGAKHYEKAVSDIRSGTAPAAAIEKAYGQKASDMTHSWARWASQVP